MKNIHKTLASFAAAGLVMAVAAPGHAVFTSKPPVSTLTATATTGGTPVIAILSAVIKNISDNATVATIGWTNPTTGFQVAAQYIDLNTNITTTSGGVQYYTDNTNAAASPKWNVAVNATNPTPAGLINAAGTQKLPTAWRPSTFTLTGILPADPNVTATGEGSLWFFHEDHAQVAVASLNAAAFTNADPFVTVYAAPSTTLTDSHGVSTVETTGGIHFAQAPDSFGGFQQNAHTFLYTEADFSSALAATTYSTNRLILEAFSL